MSIRSAHRELADSAGRQFVHVVADDPACSRTPDAPSFRNRLANAVGDEDLALRATDAVEDRFPVLRVSLNTGAGRSPADDGKASDERSAPLSIADIIARYAVGG